MATQILGDSSLRVRVYRPEDFRQVEAVFYEGMAYGLGSPADHSARAFYRHPFSGFVYLSGAISAWLISRTKHISPALCTAGILSAAGGVLAYVLWIPRQSRNMMVEYCEQCFREDLNDITKHYRLEPTDDGDYQPTSSSCFWVAEQKSDSGEGYKIVGCIGLDTPDGSSVGEVRRLSVLHSQRGKGIGSLLLRIVTAFAKQTKLTSLRLTTSTFQPDAMRLYTRLGWKNTETVKFKGNMMSSQFYLATMNYFEL
ncbi:hypothetical protein E1B28_005685 [Marasmius oreades]|uniref:N-acetyltransferase domain-containing protein n=1 Tax=Marasmius oreades TaxID=181124 RepID=A0A9P7UUU5_9AGAR|nr:uncharacterized protein E1B28_005685 [Marasmius oreades]KAG7094878.1 hypothetical protein E1B28_005685 [Marasmius oreades]